ncbi:MAG: hypothetical protein ACRC0L_01370 [Angustibacter sp.]
MPTITAALRGAGALQGVQVVASGLVAGATYTITGELAAGGYTWPVRAGRGTLAAGTQVVLGDAATPINRSIRYRLVSSAGDAVSASVTVPWSDSYGKVAVLCSLDGTISVPFLGVDDGLSRDLGRRVQTYAIQGRASAVSVYDVDTSETGSVSAVVAQADLPRLRALLSPGGPILLRTNGQVRDVQPVEYWAVTAAKSTLVGVSSDRMWQLDFTVLDDPEPDRVTAISSWDDFDAAWAGRTWNDFDAAWSARSWDEFDRFDWTA